MPIKFSANLSEQLRSIGLGLLAGLSILVGLAIWYPSTNTIPTKVFDHAVADQITFPRPVKVLSGPTPQTAGLTASIVPAGVKHPVVYVNALFAAEIQLDLASVVTGARASAHLMSVGAWTAIAAVRTPTVWQWTSTTLGTPVSRQQTVDIRLVARSLQSSARENGANAESTRYAADFPSTVRAIAITTVALGPGAVHDLNDGLLVFSNVPSVCAGLTAQPALQCNGLTVLWVKPK